MSTNLTAKDGMTDYGEESDTISLPTIAQYIQYKHLIPNIKQSCWTVTPWSCKEEYLDCVCAIDVSGKLIKEYADKAELGVRPLCKIKNTLHIEIV